MKKLQCELCGSVDIMKVDDNVFQCQHCGCKYTQDEVKKILFGEVTFKAQDFEVVGGKLIKYNGESTEVVIPENVTVIGGKAFEDCSGITKVSIPKSVKTIEWAFQGCTSLREIVIPDSVTFLGGACFYGCRALQTIRLSRNIERIESETFQGCASLKEIVIPEGVRIIVDSAFRNCDALNKITLPNSLEKFEHSYRGLCLPDTIHIEGNIKPYYDYYGLNENTGDLSPSSNVRTVLNSGGAPDAIRKYAEQIRSQRRAMNRCENCGGRFKGIINKQCEKCGLKKTY